MSETETETETLVEAALRVLNTADLKEKARLGDEVATQWLLHQQKQQPYHPSQDFTVPDRPSRPSNVISSSPSFQIAARLMLEKCLILRLSRIIGLIKMTH